MRLDPHEVGDVHIGGTHYKILSIGQGVLASGPSVVRTAIVSDTVEELMDLEAYREATTTMLKSVHRRGIEPDGVWVVGQLPIDWPLWRDALAPEVGDQVATKIEEINGHVAVFFLADSAKLDQLG
jgi:hypothetical protein